ncbi:chitodextrinase [Streptomyces achromogenes]|uniref:fibronectin type III domain-containing protein n=1 Tax=Streptomyces achromogenes TaxID=67255 RepID=UPI0027849511|nr:chitodextrinase [Streptomyces achromogenes]
MRRVVLRVTGCALVSALSGGCAVGAAGDDGRAPGAPTGVTAAAGSSTSVHVMWNAVAADPGISVYEVYLGAEKAGEVPGAAHMLDVVRLAPSTAYVFTVRARDTEGRLGPPSREVRAVTAAAGAADRSAPTAPGGVSGRAAGSRAVRLSWSASADDRKVVSYEVYRGDAKIHSVGAAQTATVVTGLRPGTSYAFTVRARDAADNLSPAGPVVRITTAEGADAGADTAPADFRATGHRGADGGYYIDLSWTPPRVDGVVAEYRIQLDGQPATSLVWGGTPPRGTAAHSFYAGGKAGVAHRVRVRARLPDGGWGAFSAERTVTTGPEA